MSNINSNIFYIVIILTASLLAHLSQMNERNRKQSLVSLFLAYLLLTLPMAFRYNTGADYSSYVNIYEIVKTQGIHNQLGSHMEFGYVLLNYICYKLFDDTQSVFIIMALLTNYFFFKGIIYESKKINLGLAIFAYGFTLYFWGYIIIRDMLGIALVFYALRFIYERKMVKYFLLVTVATLFHISLAIFYLIGILYTERLKKYRIYIAIITVLLIPIIPIVINSLGTRLSFIWTHFSFYQAQFSNIHISVGRYIVVSALPIIPFSIYYKKLEKFNSNISLYFSFYVISIVLLLFSTSLPIITRFVYALWPSQIILFSSILKVLDMESKSKSKSKSKRKTVLTKRLAILAIFMYGMVLILFFINYDIYYMLPYRSSIGYYMLFFSMIFQYYMAPNISLSLFPVAYDTVDKYHLQMKNKLNNYFRRR